MAKNIWLCMYGYLCMTIHVWLFMYDYVCMTLYVCMHIWLCMCPYFYIINIINGSTQKAVFKI